jgi:ABC-type amino acid transport substrate-binding protein
MLGHDYITELSSRRNDNKTLLSQHHKRLRRLEEQKATRGINTPPEVLNEIEDINDKIETLSEEREEIEQKLTFLFEHDMNQARTEHDYEKVIKLTNQLRDFELIDRAELNVRLVDIYLGYGNYILDKLRGYYIQQTDTKQSYYDETQKILEQLKRLSPGSKELLKLETDLWSMLGDLFMKEGRVRKAADAYRNALRSNPSDTVVKRKYEDAETAARTADPIFDEALEAHNRKDWAAAASSWEKLFNLRIFVYKGRNIVELRDKAKHQVWKGQQQRKLGLIGGVLIIGIGVFFAWLLDGSSIFGSATDTPTAIINTQTPTTNPDTPTAESPPTRTVLASTRTPTYTPTPIYTSTPISYGNTAQEAYDRLRQVWQEEKKTIKIGVRYDAAPFGVDTNIKDDDCIASKPLGGFDPDGYDIEVVREFARRWFDGDISAIEWRCVRLTDRKKTISDGTLFIGAFSYSNFGDRCEGIECSVSYMRDGQGILVRDNGDITNICDVGGKRVAVLKDSSAQTLFVPEANKFCNFELMPELESFTIRSEAIGAVLADNDIVAYATVVEILKKLADQYEGLIVIEDGEFAQEDFSIAVKPGERGLLYLINLTIKAMKEDGTLDKLIRDEFNCAVTPYDIEYDASHEGYDDELFNELLRPDSEQGALCEKEKPEGDDPLYIRIDFEVKAGATLFGLARGFYGDGNNWECIAVDNDENLLKEPSLLRAGRHINIPTEDYCSSINVERGF